MATTRTFEQLDTHAVQALGELFAVSPVVEPYTPDGSEVYRLELRGAADGVRLILWPQLRRVDVTSTGNHAWVLKNVGQVELIEGVEAVFRPSEGQGFLFVAVNGFVNMVMG
ncbi:MAG: hypothetical protein M0R74_17350 [Dehalococcoidia bacterium]|nr:hypothetical protein [Dehalococcoidia bacterium]